MYRVPFDYELHLSNSKVIVEGILSFILLWCGYIKSFRILREERQRERELSGSLSGGKLCNYFL